MGSRGWFCVVVLRCGRSGGALARWGALGNVARRAVGCMRLNMDSCQNLLS